MDLYKIFKHVLYIAIIFFIWIVIATYINESETTIPRKLILHLIVLVLFIYVQTKVFKSKSIAILL